jgi:hypothetical protein
MISTLQPEDSPSRVIAHIQLRLSDDQWPSKGRKSEKFSGIDQAVEYMRHRLKPESQPGYKERVHRYLNPPEV